MIPLRLSLRNFLSYRTDAPVLDFNGIHVASLCGDNGHGKSALLDAITWSLWGQARTRSQSELIFHGEDEMQVELEFIMADTEYRVSRRFRKSGRGRQGATILELYIKTASGHEPITGNTVRETEQKICTLLSMEYDTFVNSSFIMQGRADIFTTSTPSRRKELLGDILGLGRYDTLAEKSRIKSRDSDASVGRLEIEINSINRELANKDQYIARLNAAERDNTLIGESKREKETEKSRLNGQVQQLQVVKTKLDMLISDKHRIDVGITSLQTKIQEQNKHLDDISQKSLMLSTFEDDLMQINVSSGEDDLVTKEYEQKGAEIQLLESQGNHLRSNNDTLRSEMEDLRRKVDMLSSMGEEAPCPLCGQPLGEEGCKHLAQSYEQEGKLKVDSFRHNEKLIRDYDLQINELKSDIEKAKATINDLVSARDQKRKHLIQLIADAKASRESMNHITSMVERDKLELEGLIVELDKVTNSIPHLESEISDLPEISMNVYKIESEMQKLINQQEELLREIGAMQESIDRCSRLESELVEKTETFNFNAYNKGIFDQLAIAFGRNGIQALVIEQAIPELEEYANHLLGKMTDHRMNIRLETQRENSSGGEPRETLDIRISDELGTRSYETYSGGEAFRVNFALRLGLSKLLSSRAGAPMPTLFIDEGFGTQDSYGLERLVEAIRMIQDDFQRIIVITHMQELKEVFPVRIEVSKTSRGSTFVVS